MSVTRPTDTADFATNAASTDPISGQLTKISPTTALVTEGWQVSNYLARNVLNWWQNTVGKWIRYLTQERDKAQVTITDGNGVGLVPLDNTFYKITAINTVLGPTVHWTGIGFRPTGGSCSYQQISANTISVGTPSGSNFPFTGTTLTNVMAVSVATPHP